MAQEPQAVERTHAEVASLLIERNGLAAHLARGQLPPMKRDAGPRGCVRCFAVGSCSIAHKVCCCALPRCSHGPDLDSAMPKSESLCSMCICCSPGRNLITVTHLHMSPSS